MDERIVIDQNRLYFSLSKSLARYFGEESKLTCRRHRGGIFKGRWLRGQRRQTLEKPEGREPAYGVSKSEVDLLLVQCQTFTGD